MIRGRPKGDPIVIVDDHYTVQVHDREQWLAFASECNVVLPVNAEPGWREGDTVLVKRLRFAGEVRFVPLGRLVNPLNHRRVRAPDRVVMLEVVGIEQGMLVWSLSGATKP